LIDPDRIQTAAEARNYFSFAISRLEDEVDMFHLDPGIREKFNCIRALAARWVFLQAKELLDGLEQKMERMIHEEN